jgi:hypothetical protein
MVREPYLPRERRDLERLFRRACHAQRNISNLLLFLPETEPPLLNEDARQELFSNLGLAGSILKGLCNTTDVSLTRSEKTRSRQQVENLVRTLDGLENFLRELTGLSPHLRANEQSSLITNIERTNLTQDERETLYADLSYIFNHFSRSLYHAETEFAQDHQARAWQMIQSVNLRISQARNEAPEPIPTTRPNIYFSTIFDLLRNQVAREDQRVARQLMRRHRESSISIAELILNADPGTADGQRIYNMSLLASAEAIANNATAEEISSAAENHFRELAGSPDITEHPFQEALRVLDIDFNRWYEPADLIYRHSQTASESENAYLELPEVRSAFSQLREIYLITEAHLAKQDLEELSETPPGTQRVLNELERILNHYQRNGRLNATQQDSLENHLLPLSGIALRLAPFNEDSFAVNTGHLSLGLEQSFADLRSALRRGQMTPSAYDSSAFLAAHLNELQLGQLAIILDELLPISEQALRNLSLIHI